MPLPVWLIPIAVKGAAAVAGAIGVGSAIHGASKMKEANNTMESARSRHEKNVARFEEEQTYTNKRMDELGTLELTVLHSFSRFSDVIEQIQNRPVFKSYSKNGVTLPEYSGEQIKEVSVGAGVLLGGLGGAALGTAGGFAAAGATTGAVMALGTASTGTAINTLSGAALYKATLAALGGGAKVVGGGGIAAGITTLSAATLGVGILVGGVIFNVVGGSLSEKADEAWSQMKAAEEKINTICKYLLSLRQTANKYRRTLSTVNDLYLNHLDRLEHTVMNLRHTDWNTFTEEEQLLTENTVLLVSLLYQMCKVELVLPSKNENEMNTINSAAVERSIQNATAVMETLK